MYPRYYIGKCQLKYKILTSMLEASNYRDQLLLIMVKIMSSYKKYLEKL